jgi:dienelactone hydrolase
MPACAFIDGHAVYSYFRDLWFNMRDALLEALSTAVQGMAGRDITPKRIIVTGFSMGGGISM